MSRRPEPFQPATSLVEWDAKGQRAVRALIAVVSRNFGRGVSGTARFWAGCIAVSQHITGPSAYESRTRARGGRKGHGDRAVASGGPLGWVKAVRGDRRSLYGRSPVGSESPRLYAPRGSGAARPGVRFARLILRRGGVLGGSTIRAACGGIRADRIATQNGQQHVRCAPPLP